MNDFKWQQTGHAHWKYRLTRYYIHDHRYMPRMTSNSVATDFYQITHDTLTLLLDYAWNGSNLVVDTLQCMRGSAVHDALCQAMAAGHIEQSWSNWNRAAREYRDCCIEDGMSRTRAWTRYLGVLFGGGNGYKWKNLRRQIERKID